MNSKQLVLDAIACKKVDRIPWVPFVGCHAAKLIDVNCEEFFKSADNMYKGVIKANEVYRPDGLPALFDLQVEAEALGCKLQYAADNPPSVQTHILEEGATLSELKVPTEKDGRFPIVLEALNRINEEIGKDIAIYGLITGPFTLALHLKGTDIFFDMYDEPEELQELMRFCTDVAKATSKMYIDAGCDIIAAVDPMTSQISPDAFAEFVTPYATELFEYIRSLGKPASFFVCGNAKNNIEEMCRCKPDNVSIDENIPLDYVRDICKPLGISFGGNIKLTVTMLFGSPTDNVRDAQNCMAIGGDTGFILAPGCDIPYDTPVENINAVTSIVHGDIAAVVDEPGALEGIEYDLPDYPNEKKVILDVITLDSESCAPCQYMMEAVRAACDGMEADVTYIEHKVKDKESVVCMLKLGVENIPTICIDGEARYISLIPPVEELKTVIGEYIAKKRQS